MKEKLMERFIEALNDEILIERSSASVSFISNIVLLEGGNVQIGDQSAERIDLTKIDRDSIATRLKRALSVINLTFQKKYGLPLWNKEVFKSGEFLSGSSLHFFDKSIPSKEFTKYKKSVGDIDTQVDKAQEEHIKEFLDSLTNYKSGYLSFIGYKKTAGQYITLWQLSQPKINVQIDIELVDFEKGSPTPWSQFSHSSPWDDMKEGIKGVFQKYILRALTSRTTKEIILLKGKKETPTRMSSNTLAFAVQYGLRQKLAPVMDGDKQRHIDGLPVFKEIATKDSTYIKDLAVIFEIFFGKVPTKEEVNKMGSFLGCLELIKKYMDKADQKRIVEGFALILWAKGAQGLYRGEPELDLKEKMTAFLKMTDTLGIQPDSSIDDLRVEYYKGYKVEE